MKRIDLARAGTSLALAASLAGCGSMGSYNPWGGPVERAQTLPPDATVYACSEGKRLVVRRPSGPDSVLILFGDREFRLDPAPAGGYTNGSTTLRSQGDEVSLEEGGAVTYANCRRAAA